MPYLEYVIILCGTNNINKDSPFDIAECLFEIGKYFKESPVTLRLLFPAYFLEMNVGLSPISEINDILADRCSLNGFYFIDQKYR